MCDLPEGYKRLDYLQFIPEPLYEIPGFETQEEAMAFIGELVVYYPSNKYNINVKGHVEPDEFVVIVPKGAIEYVAEEKKTNMAELKPELQVECFSPRLYRFIEEEYVDSFFETGALQISSFRRCLTIENSDRRDESEGRVTVSGSNGKYTVEMAIGVPDTGFILCTSVSENNKLPNTEYKCCIEIIDFHRFIDVVTLALIENGYQVNRVLCGPCNYGERLITNSKTELDIQGLLPQDDSNTLDFEKMAMVPNAIAGDGMYFRKGFEKAIEHEYRIVWDISNCENETIIIKVPEAIKYCQKKSY